jgi:Glycosyl transferases group 1
MKVLIIQEAGRHPENARYRECFGVKEGFINNGWEADVWGLGHDNFSTTPDFAAYNLIFILENYTFEWLPDWSKVKTPKVQWVIDAHCADITKYAEISNNVDAVLHSTKALINYYAKHTSCPNHIWFPNAVSETLFYPLYYPKIYDCSFVASNIAGRSHIAKFVGAELVFLLGNEMTKRIDQSKVHFNKSLSVDTNYRCFETIALRTALVTNFTPDLKELGFEHERNCMIYRNFEEARDMIDFLLKNDAARERIAQGGFKLFKDHTYTSRIENFLKNDWPLH